MIYGEKKPFLGISPKFDEDGNPSFKDIIAPDNYNENGSIKDYFSVIFDGGWFKIYPIKNDGFEYKIVVEPNDTGQEREIKIGIMCWNYLCRVKYLQSE